MATNLQQLHSYLNKLLRVSEFKDYCPNGLQIEGKSEINRMALGVSASLDVIEAAISQKADAILVHHGFFWRGEEEVLVGMKGKRISKFIKNDMSLLAYHLPLDAHNKFGNNVELARLFGVEITDFFGTTRPKLGVYGELEKPLSAIDFSDLIEKTLHRKPLLIQGTQEKISKVAICSGAAQDFLKDAAQLGVQAYVSGEVSERTYHEAKELGINYYAAGHHATEKFGVQALGAHLSQEFGIETFFIDSENMV